LIAVWRDSRAGDNLGDIWMAISDDFGATWGTNQRVDHADYGSTADFPQVVINGIQGYILWQDDRNGDLDIFASVLE